MLVLDPLASVGQGSNKEAIGGIRATHSDPAKIGICLKSIEIFSGWKERHGEDIGWQRGGYSFVEYRPEEEKILKSLLAVQKQYGLAIDWLDSDDLLEIVPTLNPEGLIGGTSSLNDGSASPMPSALAFARQAKRFGAEFHFREAATSLRLERGRVTGVVTDKASYSAGITVNAAGARGRDTVSEDLAPIMRYARDELPTAEEFSDHCIDIGVCPFEIAKMHVPAAHVVAAPYIMFFDRFIRHALRDWMACSRSDIVLVVDEAHNLPWYARELESASLSEIALRAAEKEIDEFGDPEVADGLSLRDFVMMTSEILDKTVDEYLIDEDGIIPQSLLEEELMFCTHLTSRGLNGLIAQVSNFGETVRDHRRLAGRLPRSYLHGTAGFLTFWQTLEESEYVKLIAKHETAKASRR